MIYQTFWSRAAAAIIDTFLLFPLILIGNQQGTSSLDWKSVSIIVLQHTYFIIGHAQYGQTLGKKLLGVKVVRTHEHLPIGWIDAIKRESLHIIVTIYIIVVMEFKWGEGFLLPGLLVLFLDPIVAVIHPRNRSIRDFIAKTVVIRTSPAA